MFCWLSYSSTASGRVIFYLHMQPKSPNLSTTRVYVGNPVDKLERSCYFAKVQQGGRPLLTNKLSNSLRVANCWNSLQQVCASITLLQLVNKLSGITLIIEWFRFDVDDCYHCLFLTLYGPDLLGLCNVIVAVVEAKIWTSLMCK